MDQSSSLPVPLEIFGRILRSFLSLNPTSPTPHWLTSNDVRRRRLQTLRLVCRAWNDIIEETPLLWSVVTIRFGLRRTDPLADSSIVCVRQLTTHLARAGIGTPLHIEITFQSSSGYVDYVLSTNDDLIETVNQAISRARRLSIIALFLNVERVATLFLGSITHSLESLRILSRPWEGNDVADSVLANLHNHHRLSFLSIAAPLPAVVYSTWMTSFHFFRPFNHDLHLLPNRFPNLEELFVTGPQDTSSTPIHFPLLRFLHVRTDQVGTLDNIMGPNIRRVYERR